MDNPADYDSDILLWSEKQAQIIRDLAKHVRGLPNELDLENVAEEIESVGRSEISGVRSRLSLLLRHLIKAAISPDDAAPQAHWRSECRTFQSDMIERVSPAMLGRIDLVALWRRALRDAGADLKDRGEMGEVGRGELPDACPLALEALFAEDFDVNEMIASLRETLLKP